MTFLSIKVWDNHIISIIEKIMLDEFYNRIKLPRIRKFRLILRPARSNVKHLSNYPLCKRPWRPRAPCRLLSYNEWSSISAVAKWLGRNGLLASPSPSCTLFPAPFPFPSGGKRKGKQVSEEISPVIHRR